MILARNRTALGAHVQRNPQHVVEGGHIGPTGLFQLKREIVLRITNIVSLLRLPIDVLGKDSAGAVEQFATYEEDSRVLRGAGQCHGLYGSPRTQAESVCGTIFAHPALQVVDTHPHPQALLIVRRLVHHGDLCLAMIPGGIRIENHRQRPQALLGAEVGPTRAQIVIKNISKEGGPVTVQHPIDRHPLVGPPVGSERLELSPRPFVVRELGFASEFLRAVRHSVATVHGAPDSGQRGVAGL